MAKGKIITTNKKAYHDYFVDETYECGIALFGTEVKSIRQGGVNLKDSYCRIENGEIFVDGNISGVFVSENKPIKKGILSRLFGK